MWSQDGKDGAEGSDREETEPGDTVPTEADSVEEEIQIPQRQTCVECENEFKLVTIEAVNDWSKRGEMCLKCFNSVSTP